MIRLINDGKIIEGIRIYQILAGEQLICKFEHNQKDGFADCLQKVADAVELSEWADVIVYDEVKVQTPLT